MLGLASEPGDDALATALADEAARLLRLPAAAIVALRGQDAGARVAAAGGAVRTVALAGLIPATALVASGYGHVRLRAPEAAALVALLPGAAPDACALLIRMPATEPGGPARVLAVAGSEGDVFDAATLELGIAFAQAATAAFAHQATGLEHRHAADQNGALARAAKTLNESLDLSTLLGRICEEAAVLIGAESAVVYRVTEDDALEIEAAHGLPPEHLGMRMAAGTGLAGKVLEADRPMMTEDYERIGQPPTGSPWSGVEASVAVPVHWGGQLRGVLSVAYWRPVRLTQRHLDALEAFAELAAVAFQNAHAHAVLARAARTDPLTGCLNHAAMHEGLARELERAERALETPLSLDPDRPRPLQGRQRRARPPRRRRGAAARRARAAHEHAPVRPRRPLRGRRVRADRGRGRRGAGARDRRPGDRADRARARRPRRGRRRDARPPAWRSGRPG